MKEEDLPLFETTKGQHRIIYRVYATSVFIGILFILYYRAISIPNKNELRWAWFGMFVSELWFAFYWFLSQSCRWKLIYRHTFKDRFSVRYLQVAVADKMEKLPKVDIFVCTANPDIEPPMMVIDTVLSVMAYNYPPEKLAVYLSDDGGSRRTFHALCLASRFAEHWLPFCNKFNIEPRSPGAFFESNTSPPPHQNPDNFYHIQKLYREMKKEVERIEEVGKVGEAEEEEHKPEFHNYWNSSYSSPKDHDTILEIVIDGNDEEARDVVGNRLPTLVYLAREKRPQRFHNFKAGAMNALIRVSSRISNAPIILNVDCDMYSNNSLSIQDALCFFMDEDKGHQFAYVQFPQSFHNMTPNDLYASTFRVEFQVGFPGMDAYGGPLYIGTGCFHRRDVLCGRMYNEEDKILVGGGGEEVEFKEGDKHAMEEIINLASCNYDVENTQWGNKVGLRYGCCVEDVITGLSIKSKLGWKAVYYNPQPPERKGFLGVPGTTLEEVLVQQKRWSQGHLEILLSKYSPLLLSVSRKLHFGLVMGYCTYNLWSVNCFATLYYSLVPSLFLLKGISLFPNVSNPWFVPFAYVTAASNLYSFGEYLCCGGTALAWWNEQRMWLYKRTTSYLFAIIDTVLKSLGYANPTFVVSSKVSTDEQVLRRYEKEVMEFGGTSTMVYILSSLAMINLFCFIGYIMVQLLVLVKGGSNSDDHSSAGGFGDLFLQIVLSGILVLINLPLYDALFFRKDGGKIPPSVAVKSFVISLSSVILVMFSGVIIFL